jgi:hypothetical protein
MDPVVLFVTALVELAVWNIRTELAGNWPRLKGNL